MDVCISNNTITNIRKINEKNFRYFLSKKKLRRARVIFQCDEPVIFRRGII